MRTAGVITHARKYYEKKSLAGDYRIIVERALNNRIDNKMTLEISEMTHLKLLA